MLAVEVHPKAPSTVYASRFDGGLFRSGDGGATWTELESPALSNRVYDLAFDPARPSVVYAAGDLGVARSSDHGATWARLGEGPEPGLAFALALDPANPEKIHAGTAAGGVADFDRRYPTAFFTSEDFPGFEFGLRLTDGAGDELPVQREEVCIPETLCISGAVPGRPELFIRIVGPKPNGYLWPTLVKFTTSAVDVWIEQISSGVIRQYRLEGATPGSSDLPGLFDRTGFLP